MKYLVLALSALWIAGCGGGVDVELGRVMPNQPTMEAGGNQPETGGGGSGGADMDAAPDKEQGAVGDTIIPTGPCDGILVHNQGLPTDYPPVYSPPSNASVAADSQEQVFLSHYELHGENCKIARQETTLAPNIAEDECGGVALAGEGSLDDKNVESVVAEFLDEWDAFLHAQGAQLNLTQARCAGDSCWVGYSQSYCGLEILTSETPSPVSGLLGIGISRTTGRLTSLSDSLVPVVPVYVNPVYSKEQVKQSLIGKPFTEMLCGTGDPELEGTTYTSVAGATDITSSPELAILVSIPEGSNHIEYRTVHVFRVFSHQLLIDAMTGELIGDRSYVRC